MVDDLAKPIPMILHEWDETEALYDHRGRAYTRRVAFEEAVSFLSRADRETLAKRLEAVWLGLNGDKAGRRVSNPQGWAVAAATGELTGLCEWVLKHLD